MTVTATPNKGFLQIGIGTEPGTWGPYVNATTQILDNALGTTTTLPLSNSNVVLSSAQYQCSFIVLNGSLGSNVTITLPSAGSFYTVQNLTSNSSLYQVTFNTSAGGEVIGIPWGESIDIMTDGANVKFRSFGRVGTYVDFASPTIPDWILHCTIPPYLLCDGSGFSSIAYPILSDMLKPVMGGNFVPDCRGRTRFSIDDGAGRISSSPGPFNFLPNTIGAQGGMQSYDATGFNTVPNTIDGTWGGPIAGAAWLVSPTGVTETPNMPPYVVSGITMIRAG